MKKRLLTTAAASLSTLAIVFAATPYTQKAQAAFWDVTLYNCYLIANASGYVFSSAHPEKNACTAAIQQWVNENRLLRIAHGASVIGWPHLTVDGKWGTNTGIAVHRYRVIHGYGAGGYAAPETVLAMHFNCRSKPWGHASSTCF